jgi:hypothetical protein
MTHLHLGIRERDNRTQFPASGVVIALLVLPLVFWWRLWAFDPAERAVIAQGDLISQYYPLQHFAARELAAGRLPAWDPYINAGQPGIADIQSGIFYPFNLLPNLVLALLDLPFSVELLTAQIVIHFSLASLFTYLFVRRVARRVGAQDPAARFAGVVAALTFTYAGYLTSFPPQQLTILQTAVWLPLILFFLDRALYVSHPRPQLIWAGMALACALLAGHPQTAMYVVYATLAYGIFLAWTSPGAFRVSRLFLLLVPLALGVALAAVQLVPTLAFIAQSTRTHLDYDAAARGFRPIETIHLIYPSIAGGSPQYVGVLPAILAIAALLLKNARRQIAFWVAVGAVALFLSLGGYTFFYDLAYLLLPGFAVVRNQERIIFLFSFAASVLAGYGTLALVQPLAREEFERFWRGLSWAGVLFLALTPFFYFVQTRQQDTELNLFGDVLRQHPLLLLFLGSSATLVALRRTGRVRLGWLAALTLGIIWLNLFAVNGQSNLTDRTLEGAFPETGLVAFLKAQPGTFRISSMGLLPGGASAGAVYEIEDITATTPLRLDTFQQFEERVDLWRRWQLLNVRYVLDQVDIDRPWLQQVFEEGKVKAYRVADSLPRAWVVHNGVTVEDEQALAVLNAQDFNPMETALLEPRSEGIVLSGGPGSDARVVEASPGRLVLEVSPNGNGLLMVSQPFYPGWRARVDGRPAPIFRANYLLQAIPINADTGRVELVYHLSPLPALFSLAALTGCIAGLAIKRRRALWP